MSSDKSFNPFNPSMFSIDNVTDTNTDTLFGVKKDYPRAIRKGNLKEDFGIDVDCYVLNDTKRTAIITQTGFILALGYKDGGGRIKSLKKILSQTARGLKLSEKLSEPLIFNASLDKEGSNSMISARGLNVELLIDICQEIIELSREGKLYSSQKPIAEHASVIVSAAAKLGIKNLIYKVSGYEPTKEEIINSFKAFIADEITKKYESVFTDELYDQWYRIFNITKPDKGKNWKLMHLTMDHIYYNVAKSKGKIKELLLIKQEENKEKRKRKLHEFLLAETGLIALRETIAKVTALAAVSETPEQYKDHIEKLFGKMEIIHNKKKIKRHVLISATENCDLGSIRTYIMPYASKHKLENDEVIFVVVNDDNDPCYRLIKEFEIPYSVECITVESSTIIPIPLETERELWNNITHALLFKKKDDLPPKVSGFCNNGNPLGTVKPIKHTYLIQIK